jgi:hypothetical protein
MELKREIWQWTVRRGLKCTFPGGKEKNRAAVCRAKNIELGLVTQGRRERLDVLLEEKR